MIKSRLEKLELLKKSGKNPYPNDFRPDTTTRELLDSFGKLGNEELQNLRKRFSLAGRIMAVRGFGKATFLQIQERTGRIQVYLQMQAMGEEAYKNFINIIDAGDFIGVTGTLFRTRTGEFTVKVESARLLVKSLRPLPEKWHGLQDVEMRYRQRYLDLIANEDVRHIFITRAKIIKKLREYLDGMEFLEVETPMMQRIPGGATARPFKTHHNALKLDLYMRIAPELYLKRLVVGGLERVYEINRNFRNEGISTVHNPEFTMLEFYMAYATYEDLMNITEDMLREISMEVAGRSTIIYGDREIDMSRRWERISFHDAIQKYSGIKADGLENLTGLRDALKKIGVQAEESWGTGKLLMEIFERTVEPNLIQPTFIYGYPLEVSPLARRNDNIPSIVDRFELFIAGIEIANAFSELNDPHDQKERFAKQVEAKKMGDEEAQESDDDYVRALEYGLPPTAGEGIGIDRLVMLLTGAKSIREVILFPLLRPEK